MKNEPVMNHPAGKTASRAIDRLDRALRLMISLPGRAAVGLIGLYRGFISPLKPPCCRFQPTCSQYAVDAIREWGLIAGLTLAVWRLLRCNPFGRGGYDPVPKNILRKNR